MDRAPEDWIGRQESCVDALDTSLASCIAAMLARPFPQEGEVLPPLWHWAFFQIPVPPSGTGPDGHIAPGEFLPKSEGNTRMWAGGRVEFHRPLLVGLRAARQSSIKSVTEKTGRSGKLLFVTVEHQYRQNGELCLSEEQDIVYKEPAPDQPYATGVEGYPGLVVHGPLIATLMVQAFLDANPGHALVRLAYRGLRPLTVNKSFKVEGRLSGDCKAILWAANEDGPAHEAEIEFEEID